MKKRRGNTRYFAKFAAAIIGVYILISLIIMLIYNLNIFLISEVRFTGQKTILLDNLIQSANDLIGQNLFRVPEAEIKKHFTSYSRIKDLYIRRRLFDKLQINIIERLPIFQIKTADGKILLVDIESVLLSDNETAVFEDIPIISVKASSDSLKFGNIIIDPFLNKMLAIYPEIMHAEPNFLDFISEIYEDQDDLYLVEYKQGYKLIFDSDKFVENVRDYMEIKNTFSFDSNTTIDMTLANNYRVTKRGHE